MCFQVNDAVCGYVYVCVCVFVWTCFVCLCMFVCVFVCLYFMVFLVPWEFHGIKNTTYSAGACAAYVRLFGYVGFGC